MKALVFILVLANALFFAFGQGYLWRPDNPDAARLSKQLNPQTIVVVSRGEPSSDKPPEESAKSEQKPESKGDDKGVPKTEAKPEGKPETRAEAKPEPTPPKADAKAAEACLAWSHVSSRNAEKLGTLVGDKFDDFKLSKKAESGGSESWWVYIPPLPNKADAEKKAGELKKLGLGDFFVIQDAGPNRWGISLGVYSTEGSAKERLSKLRDKGVKSAKMATRPGKDATYQLEARGPASKQKALQDAVTALSSDFVTKLCP